MTEDAVNKSPKEEKDSKDHEKTSFATSDVQNSNGLNKRSATDAADDNTKVKNLTDSLTESHKIRIPKTDKIPQATEHVTAEESKIHGLETSETSSLTEPDKLGQVAVIKKARIEETPVLDGSETHKTVPSEQSKSDDIIVLSKEEKLSTSAEKAASKKYDSKTEKANLSNQSKPTKISALKESKEEKLSASDSKTQKAVLSNQSKSGESTAFDDSKGERLSTSVNDASEANDFSRTQEAVQSNYSKPMDILALDKSSEEKLSTTEAKPEKDDSKPQESADKLRGEKLPLSKIQKAAPTKPKEIIRLNKAKEDKSPVSQKLSSAKETMVEALMIVKKTILGIAKTKEEAVSDQSKVKAVSDKSKVKDDTLLGKTSPKETNTKNENMLKTNQEKDEFVLKADDKPENSEALSGNRNPVKTRASEKDTGCNEVSTLDTSDKGENQGLGQSTGRPKEKLTTGAELDKPEAKTSSRSDLSGTEDSSILDTEEVTIIENSKSQSLPLEKSTSLISTFEPEPLQTIVSGNENTTQECKTLGQSESEDYVLSKKMKIEEKSCTLKTSKAKDATVSSIENSRQIEAVDTTETKNIPASDTSKSDQLFTSNIRKANNIFKEMAKNENPVSAQKCEKPDVIKNFKKRKNCEGIDTSEESLTHKNDPLQLGEKRGADEKQNADDMSTEESADVKQNGDELSNTTEESHGTPSLEVDALPQTEALEALIRLETMRQLEAAWEAQRRLVRACHILPTTEENGVNQANEVPRSKGESLYSTKAIGSVKKKTKQLTSKNLTASPGEKGKQSEEYDNEKEAQHIRPPAKKKMKPHDTNFSPLNKKMENISASKEETATPEKKTNSPTSDFVVAMSDPSLSEEDRVVMKNISELKRCLSASKQLPSSDTSGYCSDVSKFQIPLRHYNPLKDLHRFIVQNVTTILKGKDKAGNRDSKRRMYGFLPGQRARLLEAGIKLKTFGETSDYEHQNLIQNACINLEPKHDKSNKKGNGSLLDGVKNVTAPALTWDALEAVTKHIQPLVPDNHRSYVSMDHLIAVQPNLPDGVPYQSLHMENPRHDGFGVVIVILALFGDASKVIVASDNDNDANNSVKGLKWSFSLRSGEGYILSGESRHFCRHGVLSDKAAEMQNIKEAARVKSPRKTLILRYGLHS